ncbi:MAG: DUF1311 domain-containing protein [Chitinispirillaceae bacterium]|nr:DUF1311 domain-containing protein [Chitinispirillaceae bacterium]
MKRLYVLKALLLLLTLLVNLSESVSFDCKSMLQPDEQVICNSEELSSLDNILSELYSIALKRISKWQKSELKETQRKWLNDRKILCATNHDCINQHYLKRIEQLEYLLSNTDNNFKLGCTVICGSVRGLYNIMQSIIMFNVATYDIYTAFIDHDTVMYFATNKKYKNTMPYTIEMWKSNSNTYPVISGFDGTSVKTKLQVAQDTANRREKIFTYSVCSISIIAGFLISTLFLYG